MSDPIANLKALIELKSVSTHQIEGRGKVFVVNNPTECRDFLHLVKRHVRVDGAPYEVRDVEAFSKYRPWKVGELIGLVVTPLQEVTLSVPGIKGMERTGTLQELRELIVAEDASHLFFMLKHPSGCCVTRMLEAPFAALRGEIKWGVEEREANINEGFALMQGFLDKLP